MAPRKAAKIGEKTSESSKVAEAIAKEAVAMAQIPPGETATAQVPPSKTSTLGHQLAQTLEGHVQDLPPDTTKFLPLCNDETTLQ
jgi:hypothetical protein